MIDGVLIFIGGMLFGAPFWVALAWHRFCRTERPKLEVNVDPAVIAQINEHMVMGWLNQRGLVWMPKGVDFKAKVK